MWEKGEKNIELSLWISVRFDREIEKKILSKLQGNAKLHKAHTQCIFLSKITPGHPQLQGEINANHLQACTADELQKKKKSASMQSAPNVAQS